MKAVRRYLFAVAAVVAACWFGPITKPGRTAAAVPTAVLIDAPPLKFPAAADCNSPAHWDGDTLYLFNSTGHPSRSYGTGVSRLGEATRVKYDNVVNGDRWIEATFKDDDGALYGWYHNEPDRVCSSATRTPRLTAPRIGAARSSDNGATWQDLGIILEAPGDQVNCGTDNFYFAGGNGDFSVIADDHKKFFYFLTSAYGDRSEQGVTVARMPYSDLNAPVGKVWKWHKGNWQEPGRGGQLTPIFSVQTDWHRPDANAFWGPSVHWNSYLRQYVMLLNRAKNANWTQEGVYVSFNPDLSQPERWSAPAKIMDGLRWYPQVIGTSSAKRETDKVAGRTARFFLSGKSRWTILFLQPGETDHPMLARRSVIE